MKLIPQPNNTQRTEHQRFANHRVIIAMLLLLAGLAPTTGCQLFDRFRSSPQMNSPVVFTELPTKEQIVTHLTNQTQRIEQLQSDVKVSVAGMPALRGTLAVERPDRLRMNAGLLGVSELGIDVGSNQDVFWFWTKIAAGGEQPAIYYAEHDAYQRSALQRVLPIEPSWVIDSLGLMEFDSNDRIEGPFQRPDGFLEIRTYRNKSGQTTTRVTVLDRKYGWVIRQSVYDSTSKLLAFADSKSHEHYPEYQVSLPGQVIITTYNPDGSDMQLTINASRFRINSIYGDPDKLWSMPNPSDVPQINLVEMAESQRLGPVTSEGVSHIHRHTVTGEQGIANRSIIRHLR